jgi:hypothetical protein
MKLESNGNFIERTYVSAMLVQGQFKVKVTSGGQRFEPSIAVGFLSFEPLEGIS